MPSKANQQFVKQYTFYPTFDVISGPDINEIGVSFDKMVTTMQRPTKFLHWPSYSRHHRGKSPFSPAGGNLEI